MSIIKRRSKVQQEIDSIAVPSTADVFIPPAEEEYRKAFVFRKKLLTVGLVVVFAAEGIIAGGMAYVVKENNLLQRVSREHEIRSTGLITMQTGSYSGDTDFGYFLGDGDFRFNSGETYSGGWSENAYEGLGELKIPSEGSYTGEFSGFVKSGEGTFAWDDGTIYTGSWKDDGMNGQGEYREPGGVVYAGTFKDNAFESGVCTFSNNTGEYSLTYKAGKITSADIAFSDGATYEGEADTNTISGVGEMVFPTGEKFSGSFDEGKRSGSGTYSWAGGDSYDGEWSSDQMSGTGTYTYKDGSVLQGTFKDNLFSDGTYHVTNDFGEYLFNFKDGEANAVAIILPDGTQFAGEIKEGGLNGAAQIKYSNGDTYEGNVSNAVKSGQGTYRWTSGASYEGAWEDDQMSGRGTYMYPSNEDGYKLVGEFKNGVPDGECKYYVNSSTSYDTTWSDGKCIKVTE